MTLGEIILNYRAEHGLSQRQFATIRRIMRWSTTRMLDRYAHPQTSDALTGINQIKKAPAPQKSCG